MDSKENNTDVTHYNKLKIPVINKLKEFKEYMDKC